MSVNDVLMDNCKMAASSLESCIRRSEHVLRNVEASLRKIAWDARLVPFGGMGVHDSLTTFAGIPPASVQQGTGVVPAFTDYSLPATVARTLPAGSIGMPLGHLLWDPRAALRSFPMLQPPAVGPLCPNVLATSGVEASMMKSRTATQLQGNKHRRRKRQRQASEDAVQRGPDKSVCTSAGVQHHKAAHPATPAKARKPSGAPCSSKERSGMPRRVICHAEAQASVQQRHKRSCRGPSDSTAHVAQQPQSAARHEPALQVLSVQGMVARTSQRVTLASAPACPADKDTRAVTAVVPHRASNSGGVAPLHGANPAAVTTVQVVDKAPLAHAMPAQAQARGAINTPVPQEATIRSWPLSGKHSPSPSATSSYSTGSVKIHARQLVDDAQGPAAPGPQEAVVISDSGLFDEGETLTSDRLRMHDAEGRQIQRDAVCAASSGPALAAVSRASLLHEHATTNTGTGGREATHTSGRCNDDKANRSRCPETISAPQPAPYQQNTCDTAGQNRHSGSNPVLGQGALASVGVGVPGTADSVRDRLVDRVVGGGRRHGESEEQRVGQKSGPSPAVAGVSDGDVSSMLLSEGRSSPSDKDGVCAPQEAHSPLRLLADHTAWPPPAEHASGEGRQVCAHCVQSNAETIVEAAAASDGAKHDEPRGVAATDSAADVKPALQPATGVVPVAALVKNAEAPLDLDTCPLFDRVLYMALRMR